MTLDHASLPGRRTGDDFDEQSPMGVCGPTSRGHPESRDGANVGGIVGASVVVDDGGCRASIDQQIGAIEEGFVEQS